MRVVVIRHHVEDSGGLIAEAFQARGAQVSTYLYPGDQPLPDLDGVDHLVMLGSTCSVYDGSVPWIAEELAWLRRADQAGVPVLGICFGAQELATILGGAVTAASREEIGWTMVEPLDHGLIPAGPWLEFHHDQCLPPAAARLLARNEVGVQAFSAGRHLAVQFHPEVDGAQLGRWLDGGAQEVASRAGVDPDRLLSETIAEEPAARDRAHRLVRAALSVAAAGTGWTGGPAGAAGG
jgi:GMP synthase-like glutamine amidotransferase